MKDVAASAFGYGHAQVHIETDAGDAHAGIVLVLGDQVCIVAMVVVVRMAGVGAGVAHGGGRGDRVSRAMDGRGPIEAGGGCFVELGGRGS